MTSPIKLGKSKYKLTSKGDSYSVCSACKTGLIGTTPVPKVSSLKSSAGPSPAALTADTLK